MPIADALRVGRRALRSLVGRDLFYRRQVDSSRIRLGQGDSAWCVCPGGLDRNSVVYSFGVGTDISFELALMERFGVRVHAFEPTPRSLAWVKGQVLPAGFQLHEFGLASWDGTARFNPPLQSDHVSYSMVRSVSAGPAVEAPVQRLSSIAATLGHSHIDLLKMDIEGAEYAVLPDCLQSGLPVAQILIEFHHRWSSVGLAETKRAIALLQDSGFRIADVSASGCEFTFVRSDSPR